MSTWTEDQFTPEDSDEAGIRLSHFSNAVQVWSCMQQARPTTVGEAALTFNVPIATVVGAVEWHPWMFLTRDEVHPLDVAKAIIEHDGE